MNGQSHTKVRDPASRSLSSGLSIAEISRISRETGIGHLEHAGRKKRRFFTYAEFQRFA